jgi:hypothetical protein
MGDQFWRRKRDRGGAATADGQELGSHDDECARQKQMQNRYHFGDD